MFCFGNSPYVCKQGSGSIRSFNFASGAGELVCCYGIEEQVVVNCLVSAVRQGLWGGNHSIEVAQAGLVFSENHEGPIFAVCSHGHRTVIRQTFRTSAMERMFAIELWLHQTSPKFRIVPISVEICIPPFV